MNPTQRPAIAISILILVAAYNFACSKSEINPAAAQEISRFISHRGLIRTYHLYIPSSYNPALKTSLVVALHGGVGNAQNMQKLSPLNFKAEERGYIVVYPDGIDRHWNDGCNIDGADVILKFFEQHRR